MNQFHKRADSPQKIQSEVQGLSFLRTGKFEFNSSSSSQEQKEDTQQQHSHGINIPRIYKYSNSEIVMERISNGRFNSTSWSKLGTGLAKIHKMFTSPNNTFGFLNDNFIGENPQKNLPMIDNWGKFFFENRLMFQVNLMNDAKTKTEWTKRLKRIEIPLCEYLNKHKPIASCVHGDLWSGNVLADSSNTPWLIDAGGAHYADREVDIAMSHMFGSFGKEFYDSYDKEFPLAEGWKDRVSIYNLYHYLNHYNLFGFSYYGECERVLKTMEKKFLVS